MANDSILIQVQLGSPTRANINAVTKQIQSALSNVSANVQIQNGRQAAQQLQTIKTKTDSASKSMNSFGEAIGLSGRRFLAFTSAVAVVGRLTSALSQATREAIKFEREFVKLAQVFDTDVKALRGLQNSISGLAQEFGLSANVIAKTSVVLAQSGLTAKQTEQAMKALAKTTLAATFDSLAASTEGAVAIMAQFGTEASKLESQFGAINAVSKRFAVESGDIIEAVRRAGGAFKAAGGDLNDFIGLFTAVRSTTRESAETIATGFRTIFARIQRPKTIDFFRQLNIELTDGRGNFIGAFKAIKRLSNGLEQAGIRAGSLKFASVVEQLGGIRQVSRVIPLLKEFTKAERARQVAQQGGASLDADAAKAQATLAQQFARTTENFRALIREISQTETFQAMVRIALDLANALIEVARAIKPLIPLLATFGAIKIGGLASGALKKGFGGAGGTGGLGKGFNRGGPVPGTGNSDTVPAMLTPGEFVIRKSAVQAFGAENLAGINKYAQGNVVSASRGFAQLQDRIKNVPQGFTTGRAFNRKDEFTANIRKRPISVTQGSPAARNAEAFEALAIQTVGAKRTAHNDFLDGVGAAGGLYEAKSGGFRTSEILGKLASHQLTRGAFRVKGKTTTDNDIINLGNVNVLTRSIKPPQAQKRATGGSIPGAGTDTVPALLTPGEFVVNKKSAETFGYGNLRKINKYNKGGVVGVQKFKNGGEVSGGGRLADFGQRLFGLSFVLSTLTATLDGVGDEFKVLSSSLASFGVSMVVVTSIIKKLGKEGPKLFSSRARRVRSINERRDKRDLDPLPFSRFSKSIVVAQAALLIFGTILAGVNAISQARLAQSELELKQAKESGNFAVIQEKARQKASNEINAKFLIALSAVTAGLFLLNPIAGSLAAVGTLVVASMKDLTPVINTVITTLYSFASGIVDATTFVLKGLAKFANSFGLDIDISGIDQLNDLMKETAATGLGKFLPAVTKATSTLSALGEASSASVDQLVKNRERSESAFGIAGTDAQKSRVLDSTINSLKTDLGNLDSGIESFDAAIAKTRRQFEQDLAAAGADPKLQQAARKRFVDAEKKATEERRTALQAENKERLTSIGQYAAQSRQIGEANRIQRDLNNGQKIQRDANNVITQQSLKNNSVLKNTFLALQAEGLSTEDALERLTASVDGSSNALAAFVGNLGARSKTLGEFLRKLTTGNIQDRIKTDRTISQGAQAIRSGSLRGVPASQQSGVIDFIGSMFGLGAVSNQQARAIFNERVGAGQVADIEEAIANRIRSENPNETEEGIASAVAEQMKIVVAGFFGQDPVAAANKAANEATAKNTERAANAAEKQNEALANAGDFAAGGTVYANQGALVNFKPKGTDTVPAMLTPGEFVVRKSSVDKYGTGMMKSINAGTFSGGGTVKYLSGGGLLDDLIEGAGRGSFLQGMGNLADYAFKGVMGVNANMLDYLPGAEQRRKNKQALAAFETQVSQRTTRSKEKQSEQLEQLEQIEKVVDSKIPLLNPITQNTDLLAGTPLGRREAMRPPSAAEVAAAKDAIAKKEAEQKAIAKAERKNALLEQYTSNLYGDNRSPDGARAFLKTNRAEIEEHFGKISDFRSAARLKRVETQKQDREDAKQDKIKEGRSDKGRFDSKGRLKRDPVNQEQQRKARDRQRSNHFMDLVENDPRMGRDFGRMGASSQESRAFNQLSNLVSKYLDWSIPEDYQDLDQAGILKRKQNELERIKSNTNLLRSYVNLYYKNEDKIVKAQDHKTIEQQINEMESISASISTAGLSPTEQNRKREAALSKRMRADSKIGPSDKEIAKNAERAKRLRAAADASRAELEKEGISPLGTSKYDKSFDPTAALMTKEEHDKMFETMYAESDARKAQTEREISGRKAADRNRIKGFIIDDLNFINEYGNRNNRLNRLISKYGSVGNDLLNNDPDIINLRKKVFNKVIDQEGGGFTLSRRMGGHMFHTSHRVRPKRETETDQARLEQIKKNWRAGNRGLSIATLSGGKRIEDMSTGEFFIETLKTLAAGPALKTETRTGRAISLGEILGRQPFVQRGLKGAYEGLGGKHLPQALDDRFEHLAKQFHSGGMIPGRAERPLYAQGGEFVMQRSAVNRIGAGNLHYMNNGGNVPANGTMNVMGGESISDAAGRLENALSNHTIPETISVQLGNLSVDIGGNVLPGMEIMVKEAIAEALMDFENTKDTDNSPGSYGRSVAQERFGNTA